jgi:signal transduction histidine kinase
VDPLEVLAQLRAELKPRLDAKPVLLTLPEEAPLLRCDRTHLYQVFSNLLGNALDHMGDVDNPAIRVEITNGGTDHRICVRDNGRGVDPADHERIFEVFQSLSPRPSGRPGTGVGLAIVKKIARTHGGDAWVESAPGKGAAFHVSLPLH